MTGAFWILVFVIVVGIILYIYELGWRKRHPYVNIHEESAPESQPSMEVSDTSVQPGPSVRPETGNSDGGQEECCGLHLVCEKDSLSPMSADIIYYDDEELDRFIGRLPESYTPEEVEEFRDVLMTMLPQDVAGWARSITQRHLELPPEVRDELLMLVNEQRAATRG